MIAAATLNMHHAEEGEGLERFFRPEKYLNFSLQSSDRVADLRFVTEFAGQSVGQWFFSFMPHDYRTPRVDIDMTDEFLFDSWLREVMDGRDLSCEEASGMSRIALTAR